MMDWTHWLFVGIAVAFFGLIALAAWMDKSPKDDVAPDYFHQSSHVRVLDDWD